MPENKKITKFKSLSELIDEHSEIMALLARLKAGKIDLYMPNPNLSEPYRESQRRLGGLR